MHNNSAKKEEKHAYKDDFVKNCTCIKYSRVNKHSSSKCCLSNTKTLTFRLVCFSGLSKAYDLVQSWKSKTTQKS